MFKNEMVSTASDPTRIEPKLDFEVLFRATPSPYLILSPDPKFTIVEVNDAYLAVSQTQRENMVGKGVCEVFPDSRSDQNVIGVTNLQASLEKVVNSRKTDTMPIQKYDIPCQESENGFEVRYWSPHNVPVFGKQGTLDFVIHRVEDVTEFVRLKEQNAVALREAETLQARVSQMEGEIYQHSKEIGKTQEALRSSNEHYQMLTAILPVGVFHADQTGNCFYVNPQWQEITGLEFSSLKNKHWFQLVPAAEQAQALENWQQAITKKEVFKIEFCIALKNEQNRWVLAQIAPEVDTETHQVKAYVGLLTNIAEPKKVEEERKKRAEELTGIVQAKMVFFSNVSHEFKTPLTLILESIEESLIKNELSSTQHEMLSLIRRNALQLLKLTNALLEFSLLEAGRMKSCYEPTDLGQLTIELIEIFRTAIERIGLKLNVEVSSLDELVYVDKDIWQKIVFHLLSNALKYTIEGAITVTLRKRSNFVELKITDTGTGISSKELMRTFDRVEQLSGGSQEGIGLSLTKEFVKLHGGDIHVNSEEGKGSTFIVYIPLGKMHLPQERIKDKPTQEAKIDVRLATAFIEEALRRSLAPPLSFPAISQTQSPLIPKPALPHLENLPKKKILVADDNADMREYLRSLLSPYWEVWAVEDSEAAFRMALQEKPNLILVDIMMLKIDGFQLIKKLRELTEICNMAIILLSEKAHEDACVEGVQLGADDYLVKPFSNNELVGRLNKNLKFFQLRVELERRVKERAESLYQTNVLLQKKIRELNEADAALAKSEEIYRILATISPTGIFNCNKEGFVSYFDEKSCKLLGLTLEEAQGTGWIKAIHPEDEEQLLTAWYNFSKGNAQFFKEEFRYLHRDSSSVWVVVEVVAEEGKDACVGTITDITELKNLEQKRLHTVKESEEQQRKRADEAEKHRKRQEQFIDTMCHELRNPLNGICGNVDLLETSITMLEKMIDTIEMTSLRDKILQHITQDKESIKAIATCAQHQKVIADDILNLSKLEAGKIELVFVEFNPNRVIKDILNMLNVEINKKNIQVCLNLPNDTLINGDQNRLLQILLNLMSNSLKFTPMGGKITIAWFPSEPKENELLLSFSVEDTGIGMSKEEKERLFNRFEQASVRTSQEYGGSGLGLSISQNLVRLMGGTIEVESEKGKGTKFTFTIKCKPALNLKKEDKSLLFLAPVLLNPSKISRHILVAEDNLINQKMMKRILEQRKHTCDFANNGAEAVQMWEENNYDIILMDMEMPIMCGLEATKLIRTKERSKRRNLLSIPIIGISGNAREEQAEEAKKYGIDDYLTKPFNKETLFEKISFYTADRDQEQYKYKGSNPISEGLPQKADKKEEQEKTRYVLEELRTFFLEDRANDNRTENYDTYNECLKKVSSNAQLLYMPKENKQALCINCKSIEDTDVAVEEISKMIDSLGIRSAGQPSPT